LFFAEKARQGAVSLWQAVEAKIAKPNAATAIARIIRSLPGRSEIIGLHADSRKPKDLNAPGSLQGALWNLAASPEDDENQQESQKAAPINPPEPAICFEKIKEPNKGSKLKALKDAW
jgi:hypothetical protein